MLIQAKIRQKMEDELKAAANAKEAARKQEELELAKKAQESLKLNNIEKMMYTLEDKEKQIIKMRVDHEKTIFEYQKQLSHAKEENDNLRKRNAELEKKEKELQMELKRVKEDLRQVQGNKTGGGVPGSTLSGMMMGFSAKVAATESHTGPTGVAPESASVISELSSQDTQPKADTASQRSSGVSKKGFSLGGMFGRRS